MSWASVFRLSDTGCSSLIRPPTVPRESVAVTQADSLASIAKATESHYSLQLRSLLPLKRLQMATSFVIGVDVGSRSARAALVTLKGNVVRKAERPLTVREQKGEIYEQSSDQIWNAVCECVREVASGVSVDDIKGIGFDATCSLVVTDANSKPVSVSADGDDVFNVIMWCDHRAIQETEYINKGAHCVLKRVGGRISSEMEPPKLLWLKRHMPHSFQRIANAFDLPDYLTFRATDGLRFRSVCSLSCKWTFDAKNGWDLTFWRDIGLEEIANNLSIVGGSGADDSVRCPGEFLGNVGEKAAHELGLSAQTKVAASLIDAHAGVLGMIGAFAQGVSSKLSSRLCLIAGTSACHMVLNDKEIFVPGVWGPYDGAIFPDMFVTEAGQSAAGSLLDHILTSHPRYTEVRENADRFGLHVVEYVTQIVENICSSNNCSIDEVSGDTHIYPDFHGNRSPLADAEMRGMISGLQLSATEEDMAVQFMATIQALAYQTKHIVEQLESQGHRIESLLICGGLVRNSLYTATHANVLQIPILIPEETEAVLLGSAILAARASGCFEDLRESVREMSGRAAVRWPDRSVAGLHKKRYLAFRALLNCQLSIREAMRADVSSSEKPSVVSAGTPC